MLSQQCENTVVMGHQYKTMKTYSELIKLPTYNQRFNYLKIPGVIGKETFGYDRYLNQVFYRSPEWKDIRRYVIIRDMGCDLGIEDREIQGRIYIHHMNPISKNDILFSSGFLLNPEFLICTSFETHNALHYGTLLSTSADLVTRRPNDTCPWRK